MFIMETIERKKPRRTCRHQRLFCSEDCVSAWLRPTGSNGASARCRGARER
jgi:hypothetical protein